MRASKSRAVVSASSARSVACSGRKAPRVAQIQCRDVGRHQLGLGQPRVLVGLRVAGDAAGGLHGLGNGSRGKIGGGGGAELLAEIDHDAERLAAVVLYGLQLTHPHRDAETQVGIRRGRGFRGPSASGVGQRTSHELGEPVTVLVIVDERAGVGHDAASVRGPLILTCALASVKPSWRV